MTLRGHLLLLLCCGFLFGAEGRAAQPVKPPESLQLGEVPLQFYVAKGMEGACGVRCSEWIVVEGRFTRGSAERFERFLKRLPDRKPPVYFYSLGGSQNEAMGIGRLLRAYGLSASVARTVTDDCSWPEDRDRVCRKAGESSEKVAASLDPITAVCASACVIAILGAKSRDVPPAVYLEIHSGAFRAPDGRVIKPTSPHMRAAEEQAEAQLRQYVRSMGIDVALTEVSKEIPHESMRSLTREEIIRFGIDTRQSIETIWSPFNRMGYAKLVLEARDAGASPRTSVVQVGCSNGQGFAVTYYAPMTEVERSNWRQTRAPVSIVMRAGSSQFAMPGFAGASSGRPFDNDPKMFFDVRSVFAPPDFLDAAMKSDRIEIVETTNFGATSVDRVRTISTAGLEGVALGLKRRCK